MIGFILFWTYMVTVCTYASLFFYDFILMKRVLDKPSDELRKPINLVLKLFTKNKNHLLDEGELDFSMALLVGAMLVMGGLIGIGVILLALANWFTTILLLVMLVLFGVRVHRMYSK